MSPQMKTRRNGQVRPARYGSLQLPMLLWLTVIWVVLWGKVSVMTVVGGFVVATIACLVFPLPPLRLDVRVRPLPLLRRSGLSGERRLLRYEDFVAEAKRRGRCLPDLRVRTTASDGETLIAGVFGGGGPVIVDRKQMYGDDPTNDPTSPEYDPNPRRDLRR